MRTRFWITLLLLLPFTACGESTKTIVDYPYPQQGAGLLSPTAQGNSGPSSVESDAGPPPIVLADTSPKNLAATIGISMGGYDSASAGTTTIAILFFSGTRAVQFQRGETVACHGDRPQLLSTSFYALYPTASVAGAPFVCVYTSGKTTAQLRFTIPAAPTILTPTAGATVQRSTTTAIHYRAAGTISGIVALGRTNKAIAHLYANGMASVDTNHFATGPGSIALTQFPTVVNATAPAFASIQAGCSAIAYNNVTWG
jgi:hypothetical protein